MLLRRSSRIIT